MDQIKSYLSGKSGAERTRAKYTAQMLATVDPKMTVGRRLGFASFKEYVNAWRKSAEYKAIKARTVGKDIDFDELRRMTAEGLASWVRRANPTQSDKYATQRTASEYAAKGKSAPKSVPADAYVGQRTTHERKLKHVSPSVPVNVPPDDAYIRQRMEHEKKLHTKKPIKV